jgi:hypothetical protein
MRMDNSLQRQHSIVVPVVLFAVLWVAFGFFIRDADLQSYALQQIGVDAIVEHRTFALGLSANPNLQPGGDVFRYNERLMAAKQPGQFVFGALAYSMLRLVGLTYDHHYLTTAKWVTWLSSTSFAALTVVALFVLLHRLWNLSAGAALAAALGLGFGTPLLAYSGVAHHDVISGSLTFLAFTALEAARLGHRPARWPCALWTVIGLCCGLALFTSMLPALIVLIVLSAACLVALSRSLRCTAVLIAAFAAGLLPVALYNWHYFGAPWMQANMAGGYTDTFFHPSLALFRGHLWRYLGLGTVSLLAFSPLAFIGLLTLPTLWIVPALRFPLCVAGAAVLVHLGYLFSIETFGDCQFGPRYLIPLLPFFFLAPGLLWSLALAGPPGHFLGWRGLGSRPTMAIFLACAWVASVGIGLLGARVGTMNCHLGATPFAFLLDQH